MEPLQLHKVLVAKEDYYRLLRAMYAEDQPLLLTFNKNVGLGLDACVSETLTQTSIDSRFYKVEMPDGTLVGYFTLDGLSLVEIAFIRVPFRGTIYQDAFIELVNNILANSFFTSTGVNNYQSISDQLKPTIEIINPLFDFNGKSLLFLKASIG